MGYAPTRTAPSTAKGTGQEVSTGRSLVWVGTALTSGSPPMLASARDQHPAHDTFITN